MAVHRGHPRASDKLINLADLNKEPFVMFTEEVDPLFNELTIKSCAEHGFLPEVVNRRRDLSALLVMVETGVSIMLVPGFVRDNEKSDIRIIELAYPNVCLDVIVASNHNNRNPSVPIFLEQLSTNNNVSLFRDRRAEKVRLVSSPNHYINRILCSK